MDNQKIFQSDDCALTKETSDKILLDRLMQCNSLYAVAKRYGETRDSGSPVSRWHSTVDKAIRHPNASKLETIIGIIEAMGGEVVIRWGKIPDELFPLGNKPGQHSMRIADLESQVAELKQMLLEQIRQNRS